MHKLLKYTTIASTAFIVSILAIDRVPQLIVIAALAGGCVYFITRKIDKQMRNKIIVLFLVTFLSQVFISLFLYSQTLDTKYYGFSYKGDDYIYGDFGTIVGDLWRHGIFPSLKKLRYYNLIGGNAAIQKYQLYSAFIFYLFGECAGQVLLIINCFFHAAIIIPAYFICRNLNIKNKITILIFFLFLFWPSTFYWSLFNFKDPAILFILFTVFALSTRAIKNPKFINIILLPISLFAIYCLKKYLLTVSAITILYFFIFGKWKYKKATILIFLLSLILIQLSLGSFSDLHVTLNYLPKTLSEIRYAGKIGDTSYLTNLSTFTYSRSVLYFPFGVSAVLFLPFLLRPFTLFQIGTNIESIFWWCLLPFLVSGIWISVKAEFKKTFLILLTFFYWLVVLALTQANMGTLIRQKAIIYYIGFIFIGLAIDRGLKKGIRISGYQDIGYET